ncbi:MAG: cardiolipin synthase [Planctomycetota bacterium]
MAWLLSIPLLDWLLRLVMVPVVLKTDRLPSQHLAWLTLIFLLPIVGIPLYLLIGIQVLGRRRTKLRDRIDAQFQRDLIVDRFAPFALGDQAPAEVRRPIRIIEAVTGLPALAHNHADFTDNAHAIIDRLIQAIDAAQHHAHLMYYIVQAEPAVHRVADALCNAAQRGVECRFLVDAVGSSDFIDTAAWQRMERAGVRLQPMLPVASFRVLFERLDVRNHRKLAVFDGTTAHCGSMNLADPDGDTTEGQSQNVVGFYQGPVVSALQFVFAHDWEAETGDRLDGDAYFPHLKTETEPDPLSNTPGNTAAHMIASGPSQRRGRVSQVLLSAINQASDRIIITTPYFVPDEPMLVGLQLAALRGVHVQLVVPTRSDHRICDAAARAYFTPLLDAGVHIHRYPQGLLHAKTVTVDHHTAVCGSANLDIRSFEINYELNVITFGQAATDALRVIQERYLDATGPPLDADQWADRPLHHRTLDRLCALASPVL